MESSPIRTALYVRVSSQDQNTDLQKQELQDFVSRRGWNIAGIYEDRATGTNDQRPMLQKLLNDARARRFDILVCWKLDRLFRSLKGLIATLQELSELHIQFVSLRDNLDLTTSQGRLLMHLLGAFGEFEVSLIRERVKAGLDNAKRRGRRLGRPPRIDCEQVARLRKKGFSLSQIARRLGISKSAVHKTLSKMAVTNASTKSEKITNGESV